MNKDLYIEFLESMLMKERKAFEPHIALGKKRVPKTVHNWTDEEKRMLMEMHNAKFSNKAIALRMSLRVKQVENMIYAIKQGRA